MVFFLLSPGVKILFLKKIFYKKDASRVKCPAAASGPEGAAGHLIPKKTFLPLDGGGSRWG